MPTFANVAFGIRDATRVAEDIPYCMRRGREVRIVRVEGHALLEFRQRRLRHALADVPMKMMDAGEAPALWNIGGQGAGSPSIVKYRVHTILKEIENYTTLKITRDIISHKFNCCLKCRVCFQSAPFNSTRFSTTLSPRASSRRAD